MARTGSTAVEHLQEIGRTSAEKEKSGLDQAVGARLEALSCLYRGVITSNGDYDSSVKVKSDSKLAFQWRARGKGFDEAYCVQIRCDNVHKWGVTFPPGWKHVMKSLDLQAVINKQALQTGIDSSVTSLRCKLVGTPRHVAAPVTDRSTGASFELHGVEVVLCASVIDEEWLVHMGSFDEDGELCATNPFQAKDLLLKDLGAGDEAQPRKRIRRHLHTGQLRVLLKSHPKMFDSVVAVARYRAEVIRAERETRAVQEAEVARHFESSPWHWHNTTWDITVYLLWTWHTRGMRRTGLTSIRLDKLRDTDLKLPAPDGLGDDD